MENMARQTRKGDPNGGRLGCLEVVEVGTLGLEPKEMIEGQEGILKHL